MVCATRYEVAIQEYTSGLALTSLAKVGRAVEMMHVSALISSVPYRYYGTWWNALNVISWLEMTRAI